MYTKSAQKFHSTSVSYNVVVVVMVEGVGEETRHSLRMCVLMCVLMCVCACVRACVHVCGLGLTYFRTSNIQT